MKTERCVLMAEDDPNDVFLMERAFSEAGVRNPLCRVCDGQEAIEYLGGEGKFSARDKFPFPAVLLLDLKMPRKNGMDVLRWLRGTEGLRCLPVVMFSSSAHPSDIEEAYQLGVNAFVVKPAGIAQRLEFARIVKSFWLAFNELPLISAEGLAAALKAAQHHEAAK